MTPESKVKTAIKKLLKERGVWYCTPIGAAFGNGGVPDFLCCWEGKFLGIEAKAPGKRSNTSSLQKYQIDAIRAAGGYAFVVDDVSQVKEILDA